MHVFLELSCFNNNKNIFPNGRRVDTNVKNIYTFWDNQYLHLQILNVCPSFHSGAKYYWWVQLGMKHCVKDTFFKVWTHLRIKAVGDLYKYIHALIKEWESHLSLYLEYCMFVSITNMFSFLLVSIKELVFSGPAWAAKIEFEWQTCCCL